MLRDMIVRGAIARRQSYIEISNYLRGVYVIPRPRLQCQFHGKRQFCSANSLGTKDASLQSSHPFLEEYKKTISFPSSNSNFPALLDTQGLGKRVTLHGYLGRRTDIGKKMSFVRLSNPSLTQTVQVISFSKSEAFDKLRSIEANSPVVVRGILRSKIASSKGHTQEPTVDTEGNINSVEIALEDVQCLNDFPKDIIMTSETVFPAEKRYLQIRNDKDLRQALAFRARANKVLREVLEECDPPFMEVETPLLFKSTPEGAREFLIPTRRPGLAYALPQSPQQYKQILMSSGVPRYYQFAHCFRDEDLRADRQPEFTQLDMEMSFARGEDVMSTIEQVIRKLWSTLMPEQLDASPFPRMTYNEAMSKYGSDKPDLRIGMEIRRVDYMIPVDLVNKITDLSAPIVEITKLKGNGDPIETRQFVTSFLDSPEASEFINNPEGGPGVFVFDSSKPLSGLQAFGFEATWALENDLDLNDGDLLILQARQNAPFSGGSTPLGDLRRAIHKAAVETGFKPAPTGFHFLWVTHFPLFSASSDSEPGQGGTAGIASTHHPFTAPLTPEDVSLLLTDPTKATADHYDIVVNGVELGGGSRRIHSAEVQEFILRDILKMPESRLADFSHLLDALRAGCPPHSGIALGFDRLIAVMLGKESVRDVIAFPKSGKGEDVMVRTPSEMTEEALETYHLQLRRKI
ncbi:aspartyl-tRNA synthetase, putative [Coccidioides posadasii C735 delta SOWgp]|uniref:Aspartyl-tRNA synthetase, putative n=1 Tax=Coccidioides posadasii (strain C735) TaxID=222929 RepID=C5P465_COCP7|nr:aspartyl-tRNA synthetase, putative [Coccidioides posadasii C735 delta SOWgp]EER28483.1 aspartyl-tRNA synthetase, putative [Coccidioides posadasii C735 delta SOWgp]|eukprot:XP_003070628.1 aspartyl-tRNA synthetase, putative [Coccidioides posadasii C735 delta SOWgp]